MRSARRITGLVLAAWTLGACHPSAQRFVTHVHWHDEVTSYVAYTETSGGVVQAKVLMCRLESDQRAQCTAQPAIEPLLNGATDVPGIPAESIGASMPAEAEGSDE